MEQNTRGDKKMLSQINYINNNYSIKEPKNKNEATKVLDDSQEENTEKYVRIFQNSKPGSDKKMVNTDFFLTLLLKSLSNQERFILLNKLLSMDWDSPDETLNNYLAELIEKKKSDEELKETLDFEYFLWDFNNWKNFFLSSKDE